MYLSDDIRLVCTVFPGLSLILWQGSVKLISRGRVFGRFPPTMHSMRIAAHAGGWQVGSTVSLYRLLVNGAVDAKDPLNRSKCVPPSERALPSRGRHSQLLLSDSCDGRLVATTAPPPSIYRNCRAGRARLIVLVCVARSGAVDSVTEAYHLSIHTTNRTTHRILLDARSTF